MNNPIEIPPGLVDRVKAIILKPKEEWSVIAEEPATIQSLFTKYALILAAIPVLSKLICTLIFGYRFFAITVRPSLISTISGAIVHYVLSLVSVALLALIADFLAPHFSGKSDRVAAYKLAIYSSTPLWLAGIFYILPGLGALTLLGFYGGFIFFVGASTVMKIKDDMALAYTAAVVVAAIVLSFIMGTILATTSSLFLPSMPYDITMHSIVGALA